MFDKADKALRAMVRGIQQQQERVDAAATHIQVLEDRLRTEVQTLRRDKEGLVVAMFEQRGMFSATSEVFLETLERVDSELRRSESTLIGRLDERGPAQRGQSDPQSTGPLANVGGEDHCLVTIHRLTNPTIVIKEQLKSCGLTKNGRKGIWCGKVSREAALILRGRFGARVTIEEIAQLEDTRGSSVKDVTSPEISASVLREEPSPEKLADNLTPAPSPLRAVFGVAERADVLVEKSSAFAPSDVPQNASSESLASNHAAVSDARDSVDFHDDPSDIDPSAPRLTADIVSGDANGLAGPESFGDAIESEAVADSNPSLHRQGGGKFNHVAFARARAAAEAARASESASKNGGSDAPVVDRSS
jgi:hypothetical protein